MAHYVMAGTKRQFWSEVNRKLAISTTDSVLATATSGDLVVLVNAQGTGTVGIAENDYDDNLDELVLALDCAYYVTVHAIKASDTNEAIEVGSDLYYNATNKRIDMDRSDTGIFVGKALQAVDSGQSASIPVWVFQSPAEKTLA